MQQGEYQGEQGADQSQKHDFPRGGEWFDAEITGQVDCDREPGDDGQAAQPDAPEQLNGNQRNQKRGGAGLHGGIIEKFLQLNLGLDIEPGEVYHLRTGS